MSDPMMTSPEPIEDVRKDATGEPQPVGVTSDEPSGDQQVWRHRPFRRYLNGFGLSLLGDQIWFVALAWAAARLNDPAQTSLVLAAGSIPRAVLILFGGTLADRWGALRVTLISQRLRIVLMAAATAATLLVEPNLWVLAAIALAFGAVDAAHMPAAAALPPQLLARSALPAGQGLVQTLERVATIVGAPFAGLIVAAGGLSLATAVNVGLFCAALLILRTLRLRALERNEDEHDNAEDTSSEGTWRSLSAGIHYAATDRVVGPILLVVTVLNLAIAAPLNVGVALLAANNHWQASGFSAIIAGFGAGATLGALSVVRYRPKRRPAAAGLVWVIAGSFTIAALGASPNLPTAIVVAAGLGITSGPASALLLGLVQARTHTAYLGRVMALITFSALGLVPVSYTAFGLITEATTLTTAFAICASVEMAVAALALLLQPVRHADL